MSAIRTIRASSAPLVSECAAAWRPPFVKVEGPRGPADLGTAFHDIAGAIVLGNEYDVPATAIAHNVCPTELGKLVDWMRRTWHGQIAQWFPDPMVEKHLRIVDGHYRLSGHVDLMSLVGDVVHIADWKTGWAERSPHAQLMCYAVLALDHFPTAGGVYLAKIDARRNYFEPISLRPGETIISRDDVTAWWGWLKRHLADDETYRPGDHCRYCPRALECPAQVQTISRVLDSVSGEPADSAISKRAITETVMESPPDVLVEVYAQLASVTAFVDTFKQALRAKVSAHGGQYGPFRLKETEAKAIDVTRGGDVLVGAIGMGTLMSLVSVSKGDVEDAIAATAPRGQKGKRIAEVMEQLDAAGAIERTKRVSLEVVKNGNATTLTAIEAGKQFTTGSDGGDR